MHAGLSGGANVILIPEQPFDLERVCGYIERRFESQYAPIVVVSEGAEPKGGMPIADRGATDAFGHARLGGIGQWLEAEIEERHRPRGAGDRARPRAARRHADARSTGCWRRASASTRSTPRTRAAGAR